MANPFYVWDPDLYAVPDSDLYYKIDSGSGDTLTDSQGTNDGSSTGSLIWTQDSSVGHGYYVNLDASNYVSLQDSNIIGPDHNWSVGIELNVSTELSDNVVLWNWGNGTQVIAVGLRNGDIGTSSWDYDTGENIISTNKSHPEPSAPYNIDLVMTYNSSDNTVELYLDEKSSTGTTGGRGDEPDDFTIGASTAGNNGMGGEGVSRFEVWESEIIDPKGFTE